MEDNVSGSRSELARNCLSRVRLCPLIFGWWFWKPKTPRQGLRILRVIKAWLCRSSKSPKATFPKKYRMPDVIVERKTAIISNSQECRGGVRLESLPPYSDLWTPRGFSSIHGEKTTSDFTVLRVRWLSEAHWYTLDASDTKVAVMMSGEVGCWFELNGSRMGRISVDDYVI